MDTNISQPSDGDKHRADDLASLNPSPPAVERHGTLQTDPDQIRRFLSSMFKHASSGQYVSLRIFEDVKGSKSPPLEIYAAQLNGSDFEELQREALRMAQYAATHIKRAVFCPPIAGFDNSLKADEASLSEGYALSVECDEWPNDSRKCLEALLGQATLVVASGGIWMDPATGEIQDKLHLHWRLREAAKRDDLKRLKEVRRSATALVRADHSNIPVSHPIRWPGTWHRKAEPRMARIVSETETEIDLDKAASLLLEAVSATPTDALSHKPDAIGQDLAVRLGPSATQVEAVERLIAKPAEELKDRSAHFQVCVNRAKRAGMHCDELEDLMRGHPGGCAGKYLHPDRLRGEIDRSWGKSLDYVERQSIGTITNPQEVLRALTQDDAARLFAARHADDFRYCHSTSSWFTWEGTHWRRDEKEASFQAMRRFCRDLTQGGNAQEIKEARKSPFVRGVETFARGDSAFSRTADDFDQDLFLLGTPGGTVDLRAGELYGARLEDGITKVTAVAPAAIADCPMWIGFIDQVTQGDREYARFIQQWLGYSLTGDTREHVLLFIYGPGGNGKGVFLNTVSRVLGAYATVAAADTFTSSRGDKHPTAIAKLEGARTVISSETEKGKAWDEGLIKSITGGDTVSARKMRQDFRDYKPQFKLTIVGNHKPVLQNVDEAARRRILIAPFLHVPSHKDLLLEERLRAEWPAILRWMINGCLDWLENGLTRPAVVLRSTEEYFETQDVFAQWLSDECEADLSDRTTVCPFKDLFASWSRHAKQAGEEPGSAKAFSDLLVREGFRRTKKGRAGTRGFLGVRLSTSPHRDLAQWPVGEDAGVFG